MQQIETLKRRHLWLEHELAAERARRAPDDLRIARLKKLKLAVKDRLMQIATRQRAANLPMAA
jgi:hypothetical protein